MSIFMSRPAARWLVPAAIAATVVGGSVAVRTVAAADPTLPPRSAADLLVDLQTARLDGLSGTVVQRADLGLPALPSTGGHGSSELSSLVSGSHTLRVWYAGPDKARVALLGTLGESDVIRNGRDLWTWSSESNTATHRVLPAGGEPKTGGEAGKHPPIDPSAPALTPREAADAALAAVDPSTTVSTDGSASVAGRDAYELVLTPKDTASRVGQVRIAIDAEQKVPLRVQVYPAGVDTPALEVAFTRVSFTRPDDTQFAFTPPPGATVTEEPAAGPPGPGRADRAAPQFTVVGTGWTSVLVARLPADPDPATTPADRPGRRGDGAGLLDALPRVTGGWGSGRLLTGTLFSALLTDDGRLLVGAVTPEALYAAAADPAAALTATG